MEGELEGVIVEGWKGRRGDSWDFACLCFLNICLV